MSDTASHSVETEAVTVTKEFVPDELPVPAVRFQIDSGRNDRATVRITEEIPAAFSIDTIGFHPRYDAENWTAYEDNRIVYERLLAPGDHVETVYGLRIDDPDDAGAFMREPTVSVAAEDPPADGALEEIAPPSESQAVRDLIADPQREPDAVAPADEPVSQEPPSGEAVPADGDPAAGASPDTSQEAPEPATDEPSTASSSTANDEAEESMPTPEAHSPDELLESLLTAVEEADDETVEPLAQALGTTPAPSVDARVDHLQTRVEAVAAYEAALEDFLNSRGPDGQFLPDLHDRLDALETTVADFQAVEDQLETLRGDVDTLSTTVADLETTVDELSVELNDEVTTVDERVSSLETTLGEVDDELATVSDDLTELKEWRERLGEMFS